MKRIKDFNFVSGRKYDGMMGRCYRPKDISFKSYGKVGIRVCEAWIKNIESFRMWLRCHLMNVGIKEEDFIKNSKSYQLDRIEPIGHYTPDNCRITKPQLNSRNKKQSKGRTIISAEGTEIKFGE